MEGEAGAEDGSSYRLVFQYFTYGGAKGCLHFFFFEGETLADLVGSHFPDAFQVAAEAHPVFLDVFIADLADPVA